MLSVLYPNWVLLKGQNIKIWDSIQRPTLGGIIPQLLWQIHLELAEEQLASLCRGENGGIFIIDEAMPAQNWCRKKLLVCDPFHMILLMEEILHHLGCKKHVNDCKNYLLTGAGFPPSAVLLEFRYTVEITKFFLPTWPDWDVFDFSEFSSSVKTRESLTPNKSVFINVQLRPYHLFDKLGSNWERLQFTSIVGCKIHSFNRQVSIFIHSIGPFSSHATWRNIIFSLSPNFWVHQNVR